MKVELIKTLSVAALFALTAPAFAQDATTDAPAGEETAADGEAPKLEMGEPVGRQPGQTYVEAVEGAWERKCIQLPEGQGDNPCQMYQLLKDGSGNPVAEISLGKLPSGEEAAAGASVVVPLETLLTQQLTLAVDGGQGKRYPFRFCAQPGCVAQIGFTAAEIANFKKGAKATLTIVPAADPSQRVELGMSLEGFTAAYDSLVVPTPPKQN